MPGNERERMMEAVQAQMPAKRWQHTLGVMASAVELAGRYGGDPEKADLAALLHDYAKYWPTDRMERVIREQKLPQELLSYDKELWHAPVGAYAVQQEFGITDEEVLDAIRYHTSGRANMTLLDKIVCLADYIEPGRTFPGVERVRELAVTDLNLALAAGFDSTILFLISKGKRIFPLTVEARNGLLAMQGES
ncbi:bis(5'-nucleosyl)-tetraphosphatase (symmetrical) YqeK [Paenibacillus gansuensis]|uniref:bis(5'-nucleosyl)-tetraphosphatase (symmetrical) n=1 Tax=Paenibacillus gansuensis TaxID=306542 RepID=A0ABW5PBH9_9BACL